MTDSLPSHVDSTIRIAPAAPVAANPLVKSLALAGGLLIALSLVSNGYLWHLWRQDQAIQRVLAQPNPELLALKAQVQTLSADLDQLKKNLELYQAQQATLREDMKKGQDSQNAFKHQIQRQLQQDREQSVRQQMPDQRRNPVTW